ncbi:MAG: class I SAM-dependent methyltransferase [Myxococcales bacterium]
MYIVNSAEVPRSGGREASSSLRSSLNDLVDRFAESLADLSSGRIDPGMRRIIDTLAALRCRLPAERWKALCKSPKLRAIRSILHEDPYAQRGYAKPRGYAGDPVLLDYIYGCAPLPESTTRFGRDMHRWSAEHSSAFRSVKRRRAILADMIDSTAARRRDARVLAVSCGHLREAQLSAAVAGRSLAEVVAVDHDAASLEVVRSTCTGLPVRCVQGSLGELIAGRVEPGDFDLIYAAGLYDYLPDTIARRLTTVLSSRLAPGGELVIGNFARCREAGYMEAIMDWFLVYRTEGELLSLASEVGDSVLRTWGDPEGIVRYLAVVRC